MWSFIKGLKKKQNINKTKIEQYISRNKPPKKRHFLLQDNNKIQKMYGD